MTATCKLYQDGGVGGPHAEIETTEESAVRDAIAWAEGQAGHPWDGVLVTVYADPSLRQQVETHQIECRDGAWECV